MNDTRDIFELVDRTRRRLRRITLISGLAICLAAPLAWLTIAGSIDLLLPFSVPVRVLFCLVFWAILIAAATMLLIAMWLRPIDRAAVARRIEESVPGISSRLVTVVDVVVHEREAHPVMFARIVEQTRELIASITPAHVADARPAQRTALIAVIVVITTGLLLAIMNQRMPTALARILLPTASIAPATWLRFHAESGDIDVVQGDDATLVAQIDRGSTTQLNARVRTTTGQWTTYPMKPDGDGRFSFVLSRVESDCEYQIAGGGTWTQISRVRVIARPVVVETKTRLLFPAYLRVTPRAFDDGSQVIAIAGSQLEVSVQVAPEAAAGELSLIPSAQTSLEPISRAALSHDPASDRWLGKIALDRDCFWTLAFKNRLGISSIPLAPRQVTIVADQAPSVVLESPGKNVSMSALQPLPLKIRAMDDFGIERVGLQFGPSTDADWNGKPITWFTGPPPAPETAITLTTSIDVAQRGLLVGKPLYFRVVAQDAKGQLGSSDPCEVTLVKATERGAPNAESVEQLSPPEIAALAASIADANVSNDAAAKKAEDVLRTLVAAERKLSGDIEATAKIKGELAALSNRAHDAANAEVPAVSQSQAKFEPKAAAALKSLDQLGRPTNQPIAPWKPADAAPPQSRSSENTTDATSKSGERPDSSKQNDRENSLQDTHSQTASDARSDSNSEKKTPPGASSKSPGEPKTGESKTQTLSSKKNRTDNSSIDSPFAINENERQSLIKHQQQLADALDAKLKDLEKKNNTLKGARNALTDALAKNQDAEKGVAPETPSGTARRKSSEKSGENNDSDPSEPKQGGGPDTASPKRGGDQEAKSKLAFDDAEADKNQQRENQGDGIGPPKPKHGGGPDDGKFPRKTSGTDGVPQPHAPSDGKLAPGAQGAAKSNSPGDALQKSNSRTDTETTGSGYDASDVASGGKVAEPRADTPASHKSERVKKALASPSVREAMTIAQWTQQLHQDDDESAHAGFGRVDKINADTGEHESFDLSQIKLGPLHQAALERLPTNIRRPLQQGMREKNIEGYESLINAYYRELSEAVK